MMPAPTGTGPDATTHDGNVKYRADIDGLRAIAVVSVALYHAGFGWIGGGYVGVDVFFVISGYLIMTVIMVDVAQKRFSLGFFYERRTRRIFPALFVVVLFCIGVAAWLFPPARLVGFGESVVAVALFSSNLYFRAIAKGAGYFDEGAESQLLLHTWSLAIEEQFYFLLPAVLRLLRGQRRRAIWLVLAGLAAASFAWAAYTVAYKQNYAFYIVFPRAWELLAGSLLALGRTPRWFDKRWLREAAAALGLALLLYPIFAFEKRTVFPGPSALFPVLGAVLVIAAGERGTSLVGRALSWRPFVFIGLISYSLYLWHWPIIVVTRALGAGSAPVSGMIAALTVSLALAILSWLFVESPFRRRQLCAERRSLFTWGGVAIAGSVAVGLVFALTSGVPSRFSPAVDEAFAANLARIDERPVARCLNWLKPIHSLADIETCPIDARPGARRIVVWGDSHVAQFRPLLQQMAADGFFGGREIDFVTSGSCQPLTDVNRTSNAFHCAAFARASLDLVNDPKVDAVLIGSEAAYDGVDGPGDFCEVDAQERCIRPLSGAEVADKLAAQIRSLGGALAARHAKLVVLLPMPTYSKHIPEIEIARLAAGSFEAALERAGLLDALGRRDFFKAREVLDDAARSAGATVFDPRRQLCDPHCTTAQDGVSIYSDSSHIAASQIGRFRNAMEQAFGRMTAAR